MRLLKPSCKITKVCVKDICKSELDELVLHADVEIESYGRLRGDMNQNNVVPVCCIRKDLPWKAKSMLLLKVKILSKKLCPLTACQL